MYWNAVETTLKLFVMQEGEFAIKQRCEHVKFVNG